MSTHVDGASPSVAPDPDDAESRGRTLPRSGQDAGSEWVRAEMQRRMAANRSSRGRHARRGEPQAAPRREIVGPDPVRGREKPRPAVPDPWVAGYASPGDLPENYVPRHSVQTPGPAAEPAAPISGPIPVVRPTAPGAGEGPVVNGQPVGTGTGADGGPIGGPSLPPTGLPVRRRKGPGTPLHVDGGPPAGPWSRPNPIVPNDEPARRLGAPPEAAGAQESLQSWGLPLASPPRGFLGPAAPAVGPGDDAGPDDTPPSAAEPTAVDPIAGERAAVETDGGAAEPADDDGDAEQETGAEDHDEATSAGADTADDLDDDTETDGRGTPAGAARPQPAPRAPTATPGTPPAHVHPDARESPVEITDMPTAPHPVVLAQRTTLSGRLVGVPSQRAQDQARAGTPRAATPRNIPVVGTAPPEPGSTRVRVVLSERKGVARPVRTIKEVQEGTAVGELLRRDLIRSQLLVTLRFAALTVLVLGALPAVFALLPEVSRFHVLGVRLPWLLLGLLMYPFLVGVAWRYTRVADRVEQNFADHVQD